MCVVFMSFLLVFMCSCLCVGLFVRVCVSFPACLGASVFFLCVSVCSRVRVYECACVCVYVSVCVSVRV